MTDYNTQGDGYRAACPECGGTGSVRVILGDDEQQDACPSCGGMGYLDARQDGRDLRLMDEPEGMPSFRDHAHEIAWHLAHRRTA